jgi:hypothetical protein
MAKESGIGMAIAVDDSGTSARTISNDITDFSFNTPRNVQVITGLDKSAEERLQLLADFTITLNGIFDDASNVAHAVFATVPSSSVARTVTITVSGQSLPNETFFNDYALTRAASGELTWSAPGTLSGGTVPTWA